VIRGIFNFCALKLIAYRPTDDLITTVITSRVCEIPSTKYKPMLTRIIRRTSDSLWPCVAISEVAHTVTVIGLRFFEKSVRVSQTNHWGHNGAILQIR